MKHVHFTKHMIDLFFEIRGRQATNVKAKLKIASSNIDDILFELYRKTKDERTKRLIQDFMKLAGDDFYNRLMKQNNGSFDHLVSELNKSLKSKSPSRPKRRIINLERQLA